MRISGLVVAILLMGATADAQSPRELLPNLRVETIAIDGSRVHPRTVTPGTTKGRWYNITIRNTGRGPVSAEWTPIRARVQAPPLPGLTHSELLLLTCAIPDSWTGGAAPCGSSFIGRLAPGERTTVRAFLQADPGLRPLPYSVEIGVDVCGAGFVPDTPPLGPNCRIVESNELDNARILRVMVSTGAGG